VSPQPRLWIGGLLRGAGRRLRGRIQRDEVAQLKAALNRHAAAVTSSKSRDEARASIASLLETTYALAAAHGIARAEIEPKPLATGHTRRVLLHMSQLRSSVARVARDGRVRIVTQRFLGVRGMSMTRLRSFTRLIPAELVTYALPVTREQPPYEDAQRSAASSLAFPMRVPLASRKELAAWAVSATSEIVVERLLIPYLRRLAEKHMHHSKAALLSDVGSLAIPLGLRLLANAASRERSSF
jgi:hypothetical protein